MTSLSSRLFGNSALTGVLLIGAASALPSAGNAADWLDSIQDQRCAIEDIQGISSNARNAIEASVRRAEMSILAPTPVGDLGCLNDLMTAPLDIFSGIGGLLGNLQSGLQNFNMSDLNIDIDVSGMICAYAAEKFAMLTNPLSEMDKTISGYASLAADPQERVSGASSSAFSDIGRGIWNDTYDSGSSSTGSTQIGNGVSVSGIVRNTDSTGYAGNVTNFVPADMAATPSTIIDAVYADDPGDEVFNDAAWALYNQQLMQSFSEYVGCRVAMSFNGTTVRGDYYGAASWRTPPTRCDFGFVAVPSSSSARSIIPESTSVSPAATIFAPSAETIDRTSGQTRPEATETAPAEQRSPTATIWDQLVK